MRCEHHRPGLAASSLDHIVRADHLLCALLVLCLQWVLLGTGGMSPAASVAIPFALLALLLPIPGYVWALQGAPVGLKTSRRSVRFTVIGLAAVGLSVVGFIIGLVFFASGVRVK